MTVCSFSLCLICGVAIDLKNFPKRLKVTGSVWSRESDIKKWGGGVAISLVVAKSIPIIIPFVLNGAVTITNDYTLLKL